MDTKTQQATSQRANQRVNRMAVRGSGRLLVAVAGCAALAGAAQSMAFNNANRPNASIASAIAPVARDVFAAGSILSAPAQIKLVSDNAFTAFSDSHGFDNVVTPATTQPTTMPTTMPAASAAADAATLVPVSAETFAPAEATTVPTSLMFTTSVSDAATPTTQPTTFVQNDPKLNWTDALTDDVMTDATDFHDAKPAGDVKDAVTWDPAGTRSGSAFNSQHAPEKPDQRVGNASPDNQQGPAKPDVKGTPWMPARPENATKTATNTVALAKPEAAPIKPTTMLVTSGLDSAGKISLTLNRTVELKTKSPVKRVSVGSPEIADVQPFNTNMILVTAKKPGTTQLIVWDDQDRSQSVDVSVSIPLDQLKDLISKIAPGATVDVAVANDQIVLRGQAPNLTVAKQVSDLAGAYGKVQNFIEVAGAQTVAVQVQFAEVSRSVTNDLGVSWAYSDGTSVFGNNTAGGQFGFGNNGTSLNVSGSPGAFNLFGAGSISGNPFTYFIKALRDNNLLRILQEPTLTTTSGEPASFLAGGQVPVPVPADNGQVAIEYKEFGVRLKLTPVVLGNGKIRLVMEAESSDLDYANGTTISGAAVPGLRTRRVQNTVELGEGQTISVAGLLDDSVTANKRSVPLLGDIPVLGQLFRSTRYQRRETELVILITPRLTSAMNPDQVTPLPGAAWRHPNELEQFAFGDLGGNKEADAVKDWNKPASERGLRAGETQKNTTRAQEPAALTRSTTPPPTFVGEQGFVPPESDSVTTTRD